MTYGELVENIEVMNYQILNIYENITKCQIGDDKKVKYYGMITEVLKPAFDMLGEISNDYETDILEDNL